MLTQSKSGEIWGATGPRRKQGVGDNVLPSPASPPSPPACLSEQGVALCGGHLYAGGYPALVTLAC